MLLLLSLLLLLLSKQVHPTSLAVNVFEVEQVLPLQPCVWYCKRNAKGVGRIQAAQHLLSVVSEMKICHVAFNWWLLRSQMSPTSVLLPDLCILATITWCNSQILNIFLCDVNGCRCCAVCRTPSGQAVDRPMWDSSWTGAWPVCGVPVPDQGAHQSPEPGVERDERRSHYQQ